MNYYVALVDNVVSETIPEYVDAFPGIPASERYHSEFFSQLIVLESGSAPEIGSMYDRETGEFYIPEPSEPEPEQPNLSEFLQGFIEGYSA